MPHVVLRGPLDLVAAGAALETTVHRWGRAVLKVADCWCRCDGQVLLVEGAVVELSRPLHPVAMVNAHGPDTIVRLWAVVPVERTPAVQRWLATVAVALQGCGGGAVVSHTLAAEVVAGLFPEP
jgi:hypothetical protein